MHVWLTVVAHGYTADQLANEFALHHFKCPCGDSSHVGEDDGEVILTDPKTVFNHLRKAREPSEEVWTTSNLKKSPVSFTVFVVFFMVLLRNFDDKQYISLVYVDEFIYPVLTNASSVPIPLVLASTTFQASYPLATYPRACILYISIIV